MCLLRGFYSSGKISLVFGISRRCHVEGVRSYTLLDPWPFQSLPSRQTAVGLSKSHKRLKERFLIGRNRTKRATFRESRLFQATYNIKTEKQTINSAFLVPVVCGRLAEGIALDLFYERWQSIFFQMFLCCWLVSHWIFTSFQAHTITWGGCGIGRNPRESHSFCWWEWFLQWIWQESPMAHLHVVGMLPFMFLT